ncbi:MAG: ATP-binding protein [Candidatus Shapirobacteria bacterium]|nr:ATP-binding protein [Candidatus Shapirobacteria bacterium]MDD5074169.1 ATP-binding protein [Candidatus Shapirobacteria bacterium]MDD5481792.1 ATP-binding protein [Candidatus Shapirobacteria bacterium]
MIKINPFSKKKPPEKNSSGSNQKQSSFASGVPTIKDLLAPSAIEVDFNHLRIDNKYFRSLFVAGYPRFVNANWLSPLINFDHTLDIAMFIYPVEIKGTLDDLRRKIAEMEAEIATDIQRGKVVDPSTKAKLEDALTLQEQLTKGVERFFQFGLYLTIPGNSVKELDEATKEIKSTLGSLMIIAKDATLQMEEGLQTTMPIGTSKLNVTRNMDTTSLATTFPFTSSELTANEGILYGVNQHNGSLVIFDRFNLENANSVVFGKSGSGKSYMIKLEALRSLMMGTEIIIIDPESEYEQLAQAVGGEYISFGFGSSAKINPFDLPQKYSPSNQTSQDNRLGFKLLSLQSLFKIMMGKMDSDEEAVLDRALVAAYRGKGITPDPASQRNEAPLLEDLYKTLLGMETPKARTLANRLEKFVKGSLVGIFDQRSNVNLKNPFTVFSLKNVEGSLRPIVMFIILDYIWTKVQDDLKKRVVIVDEAWYLMRYKDSAQYLESIAKRARKYYLGLTTVTQDAPDFLASPYGKAIITNSSIQILMKQHPAAIDQIGEIFYLSEGEKNLLLSADIGEGLFFAGENHVAIQVISSNEEHKLVSTDPREKEARVSIPEEGSPAIQSQYQEETKSQEQEKSTSQTNIPKPAETPK